MPPRCAEWREIVAGKGLPTTWCSHSAPQSSQWASQVHGGFSGGVVVDEGARGVGVVAQSWGMVVQGSGGIQVDGRAVARRRKVLLAGGVTRAQLESAAWISPHFGYHRSTQVNDPIRQRIIDAAAVMPVGGVVGGWAAAYLQGAAYLDGGWGHPEAIRGRRSGEPVLLVIPPRAVVSRPGITTLRASLQDEDVLEQRGIRCTSPTRTAYDVLRLAPDLTKAVVAGDCLLRAGLTTAEQISAYGRENSGRRGIRQLREAVPLLDGAAASPPESRLRLLCRKAGLPKLMVNVPVYDLAGDFLGIVDLLEPHAGLGIEYDGEYHRELAQHTADNTREEGLEHNGLAIVRVTSLDLADELAVVARIQQAHRARLFRNPAGETWTCQHRAA